MTRDPRTDPQPGDVLEWPGWRRTVTAVERIVVHYKLTNPLGGAMTGVVDRLAWKNWARHATVVKVAETLQDQP